jgi:hypothetical protein
MLPLNPEIVRQLKGMKTCLVCPERWGRPNDILNYRQKMNDLHFTPTAVMTHISLVHKWEERC